MIRRVIDHYPRKNFREDVLISAATPLGWLPLLGFDGALCSVVGGAADLHFQVLLFVEGPAHAVGQAPRPARP